MHHRSIRYRAFTDATRRPAYADPDGRQCVIGDDGERVYGTWLSEGDEADELVIVENRWG
jgi:hypothetical protein